MINVLIAKDLYEFLESYRESEGDYRVAHSSIQNLLEKLEEYLLFAKEFRFEQEDRDVLFWAFSDHPWPISLEQFAFEYYEKVKDSEC